MSGRLVVLLVAAVFVGCTASDSQDVADDGATPQGQGAPAAVPLSDLATLPAPWSPTRVSRPIAGDPFFVEFLGQHTAGWVRAGWLSTWEHDGSSANVIVQAFQFDTMRARRPARRRRTRRGSVSWSRRSAS